MLRQPEILERCIFKHRTQDVYLVADAYQGKMIRQAITDFLEAAAGGESENVPLKIGGQSLVVSGIVEESGFVVTWTMI